MLIDGQNGFILKERDIVKENPFIDFSAIKLNLHIICTCQYLYRKQCGLYTPILICL